MDLRELQKAYLDNLRQVTEEKLEIGSLIRTIISVDDGLVFKDGRKQKPKKLVIIGVDKLKKVCYGFVLVNTKMSPKSAYSASFLSAQYLLHQTDYPEFLKYDSYVDCGMLFSIPLEKLGRRVLRLSDRFRPSRHFLCSQYNRDSYEQGKKRFGII